MRRYDIKKILSDPAKRRMMVAQGTVTIQAREGIDITLEQALASYDKLEADGSLARVRADAQKYYENHCRLPDLGARRHDSLATRRSGQKL